MRHRLKWLACIVVASFVWFVFSACRGTNGGEGFSTPTPTPVMDLLTRWLNAEPCAPPCWEGIIPGETSASEAMELLEANPLIADIQLYERGRWSMMEWNMIWSSMSKHSPSPAWGAASFDSSFSNQIIQYIVLDSRGLCLGDIIHSYGEPSHILIYVESSALDHGVFEAVIEVFWLSLDLRLTATSDTARPRIDETLCDGSIALFAPGTTLEQSASTGFLDHDYLLPWDGYGDFDKYFLPEQLPDWFEYP